MQTINEARAAKIFGARVAQATGSRVANRSATSWQILMEKFLAALRLALAVPAI
jgi:hypothetical protein